MASAQDILPRPVLAVKQKHLSRYQQLPEATGVPRKLPLLFPRDDINRRDEVVRVFRESPAGEGRDHCDPNSDLFPTEGLRRVLNGLPDHFPWPPVTCLQKNRRKTTRLTRKLNICLLYEFDILPSWEAGERLTDTGSERRTQDFAFPYTVEPNGLPGTHSQLGGRGLTLRTYHYDLPLARETGSTGRRSGLSPPTTESSRACPEAASSVCLIL